MAFHLANLWQQNQDPNKYTVGPWNPPLVGPDSSFGSAGDPTSTQQPLWGTAGDPTGKQQALLDEYGYRYENGDFMVQRPDSPGDWMALQSLEGDEGQQRFQNLYYQAGSRTVTINGQQFERIGDPNSPT